VIRLDKKQVRRCDDSRKRISDILYEVYQLYLEKEPEKTDSWRDCSEGYLEDQLLDHTSRLSNYDFDEEYSLNLKDIILLAAMIAAKIKIRMSLGGEGENAMS
jgi:hypothetical protein